MPPLKSAGEAYIHCPPRPQPAGSARRTVLPGWALHRLNAGNRQLRQKLRRAVTFAEACLARPPPFTEPVKRSTGASQVNSASARSATWLSGAPRYRAPGRRVFYCSRSHQGPTRPSVARPPGRLVRFAPRAFSGGFFKRLSLLSRALYKPPQAVKVEHSVSTLTALRGTRKHTSYCVCALVFLLARADRG